jgi:hypothetical protein
MAPDIDDEGNLHDTALVPLDDAGSLPAVPAGKPLSKEDLDLVAGLGGSNVGTVAGDDDIHDGLALDTRDGDGRHEVAEYDDDQASSYPQVAGHEWKPQDRPLLESFVDLADEIGLTEEQRNELARWFIQDTAKVVEEHSPPIPSDLSDYHFEAAEGADDNPLIAGMAASFKQLAVGWGMAAEAADALVSWFANESKNQVSALDAEHRAESVADLKASWGSAHTQNVETTVAWLSSLGEVGRTLRNARTADGRRLIFAPGVPQLLHSMAMTEKDPKSTASGASAGRAEAALRKEMRELAALRDRDISAYDSPWRGTGMTGRDRYWQITEQMEAIAAGRPLPSPAQRARTLDEERRALLKLKESEPEIFEHGQWKNTGLSPAMRLHQIAVSGG